MFKNAGNKIKIVAEWGFYVETIISFFSFLVLAIDEEDPVYLLVMIGTIFVLWVSALILYGFGEIVDKHCDHGDGYTVTGKVPTPVIENTVSRKEYNRAKREYNRSKDNSSVLPRVNEENDELIEIDIVDDGSVPQIVCPRCGNKHDFDYPKCPNCKHEY